MTASAATDKFFIWVLEGEPKDVKIIDKDGVERHPDLDLVRAEPRLKPAKDAGRFGKGVGQLFFGGKLGGVKELRAQGNELVNNDQILMALGYVKGAQEVAYVPETKDENEEK